MERFSKGRTRKDHFLEFPKRNVPKTKWVSSTNGEIPERAFLDSNGKYIVIANQIVKAWDSTKTLSPNLEFLTLNGDNVVLNWETPALLQEPTPLPDDAVIAFVDPNDRESVFVGKTHQDGVGMVSFYENAWTFYKSSKSQGQNTGFQVLCTK